jgi:hypothetical protein
MSIIFDAVKVSGSDIPVKRTDIWSTGDNGRTVVFSYAIYNLEKYDLDPVGTFMWHLCDGSNSIERIASVIGKLVQRQSGEEQKIIENCIEFIQRLQDHGLIYIGNSCEL